MSADKRYSQTMPRQADQCLGIKQLHKITFTQFNGETLETVATTPASVQSVICSQRGKGIYAGAVVHTIDKASGSELSRDVIPFN